MQELGGQRSCRGWTTVLPALIRPYLWLSCGAAPAIRQPESGEHSEPRGVEAGQQRCQGMAIGYQKPWKKPGRQAGDWSLRRNPRPQPSGMK